MIIANVITIGGITFTTEFSLKLPLSDKDILPADNKYKRWTLSVNFNEETIDFSYFEHRLIFSIAILLSPFTFEIYFNETLKLSS